MPRGVPGEGPNTFFFKPFFAGAPFGLQGGPRAAAGSPPGMFFHRFWYGFVHMLSSPGCFFTGFGIAASTTQSPKSGRVPYEKLLRKPTKKNDSCPLRKMYGEDTGGAQDGSRRRPRGLSPRSLSPRSLSPRSLSPGARTSRSSGSDRSASSQSEARWRGGRRQVDT